MKPWNTSAAIKWGACAGLLYSLIWAAVSLLPARTPPSYTVGYTIGIALSGMVLGAVVFLAVAHLRNWIVDKRAG